MLEIERVLAEKLGWSLYDMDRTDIESLMPFVFYIAGSTPGGHGGGRRKQEQIYADQVDWL